VKSKGFFGVETGGTKLQVVAGDAQANILDRRRFAIDPKRGAAGIREQIESGIADLLQKFEPLAGAIGFGGPVDWQTGEVRCSHQVEGWSGFPLGKWANSLIGTPVVVDNDANIAALSEALRGAGVGRNPVFYVTLGSGVGGGLVIGGKIFHGAKPGEAELGHVRLDRSGVTVEQRCSGWSVDKKIRNFCEQQPSSKFARAVGNQRGGEAKAMGDALAEGDPAAVAILAEMAEDLGFALSHVTHLIHPEVVVLGGGLSLLGEPLRRAVAASLERFTMEAFRPGPQLQIAALGEDVVPIGCLLAARQLVAA